MVVRVKKDNHGVNSFPLLQELVMYCEKGTNIRGALTISSCYCPIRTYQNHPGHANEILTNSVEHVIHIRIQKLKISLCSQFHLSLIR